MATPKNPPAGPPTPLGLPPGLSPDNLDTLTELTSLLSRLRAPPPSSSASAGTGGGGAAAGGAAGGAGNNNNNNNTAGAAAAAAAAAATPAAPTPSNINTNTSSSLISIQSLPMATDTLKHKLQRSRAAAKTLPDMARGTADQEAEMAELEARIARQRAVLEGLRSKGLDFAAARGQAGDKMEE